jgi:hypothetical protein
VPTKKEKQPLSVTHPELAKEADGWDPLLVTAGSNKKVSWRCKRNHSWLTTPNSRSSKKLGCPFCSGKRISVGENDLFTTHPQIAAQANGFDPKTVSAGSNKRFEWRCSEGHSWKAPVYRRTGSQKSGCPVCSNLQLLEGFNDLQTAYPDIALEAYLWDPTKVGYSSKEKREWKCKKGHVWLGSINSRTKANRQCPNCADRKVTIGTTDLLTTYPHIAAEAFGWDPRNLIYKSHKIMTWKCPQDHIYQASISKRTLRNHGCNICANKKIVAGINDLATTHPEIAKEANGWDPTQVNAGRGSKLKSEKRSWRCSRGHIFEATPASRTNPKIMSGCPFCSGNTNLSGFNDLATTHPEIAKEAYGWDPRKSRGGHNKKHEWRCALGHIYKQTITARMQGGGCLYCQNDLILKGFNDLMTLNPRVALEADGWDPTNITDASQKVMSWKCSEGHKWKTTVGNRKAGKNCPTCANSGFDPNQSGWLYFLEHFQWGMLQIGITNFPNNRLSDHARRGWEVIEIRGPMDGLIAREWETSILRFLKAQGADLSNSTIAGKFDGFSEAWSKSTFEVKTIKELMRLTEEFESLQTD